MAKTTAPARKRRVFHDVVAEIQDEIFQGKLKPGDRLPTEQDLAERFGASRAAVREALRVLELLGLITVRHGYQGGSFVASADFSPVSRALESMLRLEHVQIKDLYQARLVLERAIAEAAARPDPRALEKLQDNVRLAEEQLQRGETIFSTNLQFHSLLAEATGNPVFSLIMQSLVHIIAVLDTVYPTNPELSRQAYHEHRTIVAALEAGDAGRARHLMSSHLEELEARFSQLAQQSPVAPHQAR